MLRNVSVSLHETPDCETRGRTSEGESATRWDFPEGRWQACWPPRTKKEANSGSHKELCGLNRNKHYPNCLSLRSSDTREERNPGIIN